MPQKNRLLLFFQQEPVFLFLLPVFFVLHGFMRNYSSIAVIDAIGLLFLYVACSFVLAFIAWLFYRNIIKAAFIAAVLMAFQFFFGNIQDSLVKISSQGFISKYRFIIPVSLFVFAIIIILTKKASASLPKISAYLNVLLLLLLAMDVGWLIIKPGKVERISTAAALPDKLAIPANRNKPDIYLILLDQYAGASALKDVFAFDNSAFENALTARGFHIVKNSRSNYNLTPFSMASLLSMDYLGREMGEKKNLNVGYSYEIIRNSCVIHFLEKNGYRFYNYSLFDFPGYPAYKYKDFLPYGTRLITASTFTGRVMRDLRSSVLEGKVGSTSMREKIAYEYLHFNDTIFKWTQDITINKTDKPRFIYSHFMLPHFPYYFDSLGKPLPIEKLSGFRKTNANDYTGYLQYGNKKIMELVDHLLTTSPDPPVIMLLSDHGFRNPDKKADRKYDFMNLNAIYIPGKKYNAFYDGMSNVNQFRALFNTCFDLQLPLLKDSTTDLWD